MILRFFVAFFVLLTIAFPAVAGNVQPITYQGRILKPDGSPLDGNVTFQFVIKSPTNCALWMEEHVVDMTGSKGGISIDVGTGANALGGTHSFSDVFNNSKPITGVNGCSSGTVFNPTLNDDRSMYVSFNDGTSVQTVPVIAIKNVPYSKFAEVAQSVMNLLGQGIDDTVAPTITGQVLRYNATSQKWEVGSVAGGVTSVALSLPSIFSVTGSPVTSSGTLDATLANQNANLVFAGPSAGGASAPTFRGLVANDIPVLDASKITTGTLSSAVIGSVSLGTTGVVSGSYGSNQYVPTFTVQSDGRLTVAGSISIAIDGSQITGGTLAVSRIPDLDASKIVSGTFAAGRIPDLDAAKIISGTLNSARIPDLDASKITSGTLAQARIGVVGNAAGGTGLDSSSAGAGQFLIGNGSGFSLGTLTAGNNISIVNQNGTVTISSSNSGGTVTQVNTGTGLAGGPFTAVGTISLADTSVVAGGYGNAAYSTVFNVDAQGRLTSAGSTLIAIGAGQVTSGTFNLAQVPDIDASKVVSGTLGLARVPDLDAAKIVAGTLANARLPVSGVGAGSFGSASWIPTFITDIYGRLTSAGSVQVAIDASQVVSGTMGVNRGGTGVDGSAAANGQLLIGNGAGYALGTLTAGSNITITNSAGGITIASSNSGGTVTQVNSGTGLTGGPVSGVGTLSLADTAVTAGGYGAANYSTTLTVDQQGRLTAAGSTLIAINGSQVTGGTINLAQIPDIDASKIVSGTLGLARVPDLDASKIVAGTLGLARIPDLDAAKIMTGTLTNARLPLSGVTAGVFSSSTYIPSFTVDAFGRLVSVGSNAISFPALQWTNVALGVNYASGSVGIGQASPATMLDVNGAIRIANDGTACAAGLSGAIRYNAGFVEYCNGSGPGWQTLGISGSGVQSLNGLTANAQIFAVGSTGTLAAFTSAGSLHTLNIPLASTAGAAGGLVSNADYLTLMNGTIPAGRVANLDGSKITTGTLATAVLGVVPGANGGTVTQVNTGTGLSGGPFTAVGTISLADTAVTAGGYGNAAYSTTLTVDQQGRLTAAGSTLIAINGNQITSGTINLAQVPDLDAGKVVSGTFATARIPDLDASKIVSGTLANARLPISGATAGNVGSSTYIPTLSIDAFGRITSYGSASVSIPAAITSINGLTAAGQIFVVGSSGTLAAFSSAGSTNTLNIPMASSAGVAGGLLSKVDYDSFVAGSSLAANGTISAGRGGTGLDGSAAGAGQLLIGTGSGFSLGTLISGSGISIVNQAGSITISANNSGSVTQVNSGTGLTGGPISGVGTLSLADTAVTAGGYGAANYSTTLTVDQQGRLTAAGSTLIAINGSQITSGTVNLAQVPDLDAGKVVSGTFATARIPDLDAGKIVSGTLANARLPVTGVAAGTFNSSTYVPSFTVDAFGRLVSVGSNAISFPALQWTNVALGVNYASGSVGIGQASPVTILDVAGAIRIANDGTACAAGLAGAIRYNAGFVEYCNGSGPGWQTLGISGAGIQSLNGLTGNSQLFAVGSSGTLAAFSSAGTLHTLNIPLASTAGAAGGLVSNADYLTLMNGTIPAGRVANLDASKITTGTLATAVLGVVPGANGGTVTQVNTGNGLSGGPFTAVGTISLADTSVTSGGYGNAAYSTTFTVDQQGRLTAAGSLAIALNGNQISSGTINLAQIPDLDAGKLVAGTLANARLPVSGAVAGNVGSSTYIPTLTVDAFGRITSYGSAAVSVPAAITSINGLTAAGQIFVVGSSGTLAAFASAGSTNTLNIPMASGAGVAGGLLSKIDYDSFVTGASLAANGTISVARGGTGLDGSSAASGQLLIGTGSGYQLGTLISGSGISIVNQAGSITISANNSGSVTQVNTGAGLVGGPISGVGTISLGTTGVAAGSVGSAGFIPQITFDSFGRITSVGSVAVATDLSSLSGTLGVAKGGTGLNASSAANGALLIGNGSGFSLGTLVGLNGITLQSGAGSVGISTNASVTAIGNTIVMRDGSGNTTSAQATATSLRLENAGAFVTITNPIGANYSMVLPANIGTPGQVLSTNGTSALTWTSLIGMTQWSDVANGINYASGSVGIGTASPATRLDVNGAIRLANDSTACGAGNAGALRYNTGNLEYCNGGGTWQALGVSGAGLQNLNGLNAGTQLFAVGFTGTLAAYTSAGSLHTLNLPQASTAGAAGGLISNADYLTLMNGTIPAARVANLDGAKITTGTLNTAILGALPASILTSGTLNTAQLGTINGASITNIAGSSITSGTINLAQVGVVNNSNIFDLAASKLTGTLNTATIGSIPTSAVTTGSFAVSQIPVLPASILTSGTVNTAQLGTINGSSITNIAGSSITSGTINLAQLGTIGNAQFSGTLATSQLGQIPASLVSSGTLNLAQIGNIQASQVTTGTFASARIGSVDGSIVTGTLGLAQIGALPASQITNGTFALARIPNLNASILTAGTLNTAQIGAIDGASITNVAGSSITSGTINLAQIGNITAGQVTTGTFAFARLGILDGSIIGAGTVNLAQVGALPASQVSSGTFALARIPNLNASILTAGTLNSAQLGTISGSSITNIAGSSITSGTINLAQIGVVNNSNIFDLAASKLTGTLNTTTIGSIPTSAVTTGSFAVSQIPVLPASILTSGTINTAQLGTINGSSITNIAGSSITSGTINLAQIGVVNNSNIFDLAASKLTGTLNLTTVGNLPFSVLAGTISTAQLGSINGSQWTDVANGINFSSGSVGIGSSSPATRLDVNGAIRLANDSTACGAGNAGALRYNTGNLEYCNGGGSWQALGVSGAGLQNLNGLNAGTQLFAVGFTGTLAAYTSAGSLHTLNIPQAATSGAAGGLLSNADYLSLMNGTIPAARVANLDGAKITTGTFNLAQIGNISAGQVTTGTFAYARIGSVDGSIVAGTLGLAQVGALPASQITSGTFALARIPNLNASILTAGTLNSAQIGTINGASITNIAGSSITSGTINLAQLGTIGNVQFSGTLATSQLGQIPASLVSSGTLNLTQIGNIQASQVTTGTLDFARLGVLNASILGAGTLNSAQIGTINGASITNIAGSSITSGTINLAQIGTIGNAQFSGTLATSQLGQVPASLVSSGTLNLAQIGNIQASQVTSGTFAYARIGSVDGSIVAGTLGLAQVGALPASQVTSGTFALARIPNLNASILTAGTLNSAQIGTINGASITNIAGSSITSGTINLAQIGIIGNAQLSGTLATSQLGQIPASLVSSGTLNLAQIGNIQASQVTSGTFAYARIGSVDGSIVAGTLGLAQVGALPASQITNGTFALARIPNLNASILTAGTLNTAQIGAIDGSSITNVAGSSITSGTINLAQLGNLQASQVTSGTFAYARIGSVDGSIVSGTLGLAQVGALPASQITNGTFALARIPNLNASILTAGTLNSAQIGTINGASITNIAGSSITSGTLNLAQLGTIGNAQFSGTLATSQLGQVPASLVSSGTLNLAQIGNIQASQVTTGTFAYARLGSVDGSIVAGTLGLAQVGALPASQITSGTFALARIPNLNASILTAGTLNTAQIGAIDGASITNVAGSSITSGTINLAQIGNITAGQVTTGTFAFARLGVLDGSIVGAGTVNLAQVGALPASQVTSGTFALARIPNLNASILTAGTLNSAQIGTINGASITNIAGSSITSGTLNLAQLGTIGNAQFSGTLATSQLGQIPASLVSSGTLNLAQIGNIQASQVTTGTFAYARLGSVDGSIVAGTLGLAQVGALPASQITNGTFALARIPNLNASILTAGTLNSAQIGTINGASITNIAGSSITSGTLNLAQLGTIGNAQFSGTLATSQLGQVPASLVSNGTLNLAQIGSIQASQVTAGTFDFARLGVLNASILGAGTLNSAQIGTINGASITNIAGSSITSGTLNLAQLGTIGNAQFSGTLATSQLGQVPASLVSSGTLNLVQIGALPASQVTTGSFAVARIPSLSASILTSGTINTAQLGVVTANINFPLLSTTRGSVGTPVYSFNSDSDTGLWSPGANTLAISTQGTTRVTINNLGYVGIGNTNPASALDINGDFTVGSGNLFLNNGAAYITQADATVYQPVQSFNLPAGIGMNLGNSSSVTGNFSGFSMTARRAGGVDTSVYMGAVSPGSGNTANLVFGRQTGGATYAESMRIDVSGNLVIGSTAVGAGNRLEVYGGAIAVADGGNLRMMEAIGNGTNSVSFRSPSALAQNYSMTLPGTIGTSGQVLSTDGAGVLSWTSVPTNGGIFLAASGSTGAPGFAFNSDTDTGLWNPGANTLAISTGGTTRLTVTNNGNVGIGTNNPGESLVVYKATGQNFVQTLVGDNSKNGFTMSAGGLGMTEFIYESGETKFRSNSGDMFFTTGGWTNERLRITAGGSVGIGTNAISMGSKLEVTDGAITAGNNGQLRMMEALAGGTNSVSFRAPAALAQNYIMTLPGTIGTSGQVLSTDGAGTLSWVTAGGSPTFPLLSTTLGSLATPVYSFSGDTNTGIYSRAADVLNFSVGGTKGLEVTASRTTVGDDGGSAIGGSTPELLVAESGASSPSMMFLDGGWDTAMVGIGSNYLVLASESSLDGIQFKTNGNFNNDYLMDPTAKMTITNSGFVGIGTTNPTGWQLQVHANQSNTPGGVYIRNDATGTVAHSVLFMDVAGTDADAYVRMESPASDTWFAGLEQTSNSYRIGRNGTGAGPGTGDVLTVTSAGSVGMGTMSISSGTRLEVTGGAITSGNGGEVRWMELLSNGTNTVGFRAPANLTTSPSFFLPNTAGTVGHALGLTSAGSLGFMSVPANGGTFLAASGSVGAPGFAFNSDADTGLFNPGTNTLAFSTAGTAVMTFTNQGKVGIGTNAPTFMLDVARDSNSIEAMTVSNKQVGTGAGSGIQLHADGTNRNGSMLVLGSSYTSAGMIEASKFHIMSGIQSLGINMFTYGTNAITFGVNATPAMVLNGTAQVGIGTMLVASGNRLEVTGGAIAAGNGGEIRYTELLTNGTNTVGFRAPANLATSPSFFLPNTSGTVGHVLGLSSTGSLGFLSVPANGGTFLAADGTAAAPGFAFNSDTDLGIYRIGASTLGISTAGTVRIAINNLGNIGIGTTTPTTAIDIVKNVNSSQLISIDNGNAGASSNAGFHAGVDSGSFDFLAYGSGSGNLAQFQTGLNNLEFKNYNGTGQILFNTASVERMRIGPTGFIGIGGITNPLTNVHIGNGTNGDIAEILLEATSTNGQALVNFWSKSAGTTGYSSIGTDYSGNMTFQAHTGLYVWKAAAGGPTTASLNTSGQFQVGTISVSSLDVSANLGASQVAKFTNTTSTGTSKGIQIQLGSAGVVGTSNLFAEFLRGDGTQVGKITGNGAAAVLYTTSSDRRVKENIRDTKFSIDDLMKINVRDYSYKTSPDQPMTGFIAQELYEVYPYAVSRPLDDSVQIWSVDYGQVTPLLVKGVQDTYGLCKMTESQLAALEARVASHARRIASVEESSKSTETEIDRLKKENQELRERMDRLEKMLRSK